MIKGKRVTLRKIIPLDLDLLLTWENNQQNHQFSDSPSFYSRELMQSFVNSTQDLFVNNQLRLMIDYNNYTVGCVDVFDFDPFHLRAGVGILIDADFRKKGLAKESILLLEEYAFKNLNINQLHCKISASNLVSVSLFESCGYKNSGLLKSWLKTRDLFEDVFIYQKINT